MFTKEENTPSDPWDWYIYLHEWLIFIVNNGKLYVNIQSSHGSVMGYFPLLLETRIRGLYIVSSSGFLQDAFGRKKHIQVDHMFFEFHKVSQPKN